MSLPGHLSLRTWLWLIFTAFLTATAPAAATNDLSTTLQRGLFEEEANHDFHAAIQAYQSVVTQFDKDRKLAATAVFRLGECYRKQGKVAEARLQYERIPREFADQAKLVELANEYLKAPVSANRPVLAYRLTSSAEKSASSSIVVDDADAILEGSWVTSALSPDKFDKAYRFTSTTNGPASSTATFKPNLPQTGKYHVDIWFPKGDNRATNAHWRIASFEGTTDISVNQRRDGGQWVRIATNQIFNAGQQGYAQLLNDTGSAGTVVVSDAVRFVPVEMASIEGREGKAVSLRGEIVVDNMQAKLHGSWTTGKSGGFYGANYNFKGSGNGSATAVFQPNLPAAGKYEVYEWHVGGQNREENAPHIIQHAHGTNTLSVNQQINGSQWNLLGVFDFAAGREGQVTITDTRNVSGLMIMADAIRFVPVEPPADRFKSLFNGRNLDGWKGDSYFWKVEDGVITTRSQFDVPANHKTSLIWEGGNVSDFELRFQCKMKILKGNTYAMGGVIYRGEQKNGNVSGYECRFYAGGQNAGILTSSDRMSMISFTQKVRVSGNENGMDHVRPLEDLTVLSEVEKAVKKDDWNECVIIAQGNHLIHKINGLVVADLLDENVKRRSDSGSLALQLNTGELRAAEAQFKDIQLRQLAP